MLNKDRRERIIQPPLEGFGDGKERKQKEYSVVKGTLLFKNTSGDWPGEGAGEVKNDTTGIIKKAFTDQQRRRCYLLQLATDNRELWWVKGYPQPKAGSNIERRTGFLNKADLPPRRYQ